MSLVTGLSRISPDTPAWLVATVGIFLVISMVAIIGHRLWQEWQERHH